MSWCASGVPAAGCPVTHLESQLLGDLVHIWSEFQLLGVLVHIWREFQLLGTWCTPGVQLLGVLVHIWSEFSCWVSWCTSGVPATRNGRGWESPGVKAGQIVRTESGQSWNLTSPLWHLTDSSTFFLYRYSQSCPALGTLC